VTLLPPWPGWDGLHPLVIHFPIALLLVVPVFVAFAVARPLRSGTYAIPALILLVIGTAGAFVAVETGEAAAELATRTDVVNSTIGRHAELAETARNIFAFLTLLYAAVTVLPLGLKSLARPVYTRAANAVFLVLLLGGDLLLANVAHQGGVLVHQLGVHAIVAGPAPAPASADAKSESATKRESR
jgi:uncharacterized membrane protein